MPCSPAKARRLLKEKKAVVIRRTPFTIQLTIATGETKQPVTLGVDTGYKHVGFSASSTKAELYASEVELRQDITDLLSARLALKITVETAAFDTQLLKNPDIEGKSYQQGEQLGFWNVREYVLFRDNHVCQHCCGKSKDPVLNVHHLETRRTGGDSPNNLITLCQTCHKALHRGEIKLTKQRGQSFRAETFMGIMRWTVFNRLKAVHPEIEVHNTFGYLTKQMRIKHGFEKSHCADAYCIAGNLRAKRLGSYYFQKQTRRHNRQIHKLSILKGGVRKRNQAPYEVKGFRLFDKVLCMGEEAFIFGRRSSGSFDVRKLDGRRLSAGISYKKLRLVERRQTYLTEIRKKEAALPPLPERRGLRADF